MKLGIGINLRSNYGQTKKIVVPSYHLNFDGIGNKIIVPSSTSLNNLPLGDFTIESVIIVDYRLINIPDQVWQDQNQYLASKGADQTGADSSGWELVMAHGDLNDRYSNMSQYDESIVNYHYTAWPSGYNLPSVQDGIFHHYAWVYNAITKIVKFYVDGIEQSFGTSYFAGNYESVGYSGDDTAFDLIIGHVPTWPTKNFGGRMRWFIISTGQKYLSNFSPPSLAVCPSADVNTILRLAMDEGSGVIVNDTSGNNNNGTITGATWEVD